MKICRVSESPALDEAVVAVSSCHDQTLWLMRGQVVVQKPERVKVHVVPDAFMVVEAVPPSARLHPATLEGRRCGVFALRRPNCCHS